MKKCPNCNLTYADESMVFCLEDGTVLQEFYIQPPAPTQFIPAPPFTHKNMADINSPYQTNQSASQYKWLINLSVAVLATFVLGAIVLLSAFKEKLFGNTVKPVFTETNSSRTNSSDLTKKPTDNSNSNTNSITSTTIDPSEKLLGSWRTKPEENDFEQAITVKFTSNVFSQVAKDKWGNSGKQEGTWHLSDNKLYETFSTGDSYSGTFRFIDNDTFEIITVNSPYPAYNGKKLLYHRVS